jgi:hypothetical protein
MTTWPEPGQEARAEPPTVPARSRARNGLNGPEASLNESTGWARSSAGEHYVDIVGVGGSIPPAPTIFPGNCSMPGKARVHGSDAGLGPIASMRDLLGRARILLGEKRSRRGGRERCPGAGPPRRLGAPRAWPGRAGGDGPSSPGSSPDRPRSRPGCPPAARAGPGRAGGSAPDRAPARRRRSGAAGAAGSHGGGSQGNSPCARATGVKSERQG